MSAVVTRPQQDSHRCENLCSSRSLFDASQRSPHLPKQVRRFRRHARSIEHSSVRSFVVTLSTLAYANAGRCQPTANGIPTGSRSPASLPRTSNQASLPHFGTEPWLTTRQATGKPHSRVLPSLVSDFEMNVTLLSAVQRRSLTVCAPVRAP